MIDLNYLMSKINSIRVSKSSNLAINITFQMLTEEFKQTFPIEQLDKEVIINIGTQSYPFEFKNVAYQGVFVSISLGYDPFKKLKITRSLRFITINRNVKQLYDSFFFNKPYLQPIAEGNINLYIKEVENVRGLGGWTISEILNIIKNLCSMQIVAVSIPSFLNYHLTDYTVSVGTNLISILKGLYNNTIVNIKIVNNQIFIESNINRRLDIHQFINTDNITICQDYIFGSSKVNFENVLIYGSDAKPDYIDFTGDNKLQIRDNDNYYTVNKTYFLNILGKMLYTIKQTSHSLDFTTRIRP